MTSAWAQEKTLTMENISLLKEYLKMKIAIIAALGLSVTGLNAAPYYVGETLNQKNNVTLNFQDTLVKDEATVGDGSANIAAFQLRGAYNVSPNIPVSFNVPFYMAGKKLSGESRSALGNFGLGLGWSNSMPTADREMTWGYTAMLNAWMPTSRKIEGAAVAGTNLPIDYYKFAVKSTSIVPTVGLWLTADMITVKGNVGYGFTRTSASGATDKNLNTYTGQLAASWHAMNNVDLNVEYNAITGESSFRGETFSKLTHQISPSISGSFDNIMGSAFVNIPLDKASRDITTLAFGANVGYMF